MAKFLLAAVSIARARSKSVPLLITTTACVAQDLNRVQWNTQALWEVAMGVVVSSDQRPGNQRLQPGHLVAMRVAVIAIGSTLTRQAAMERMLVVPGPQPEVCWTCSGDGVSDVCL